MKNHQKGFIIPLVIAIVALLIIGGGVYFYTKTRQSNPTVDTATMATQATATTNQSTFAPTATIDQSSLTFSPYQSTLTGTAANTKSVDVNIIETTGATFTGYTTIFGNGNVPVVNGHWSLIVPGGTFSGSDGEFTPGPFKVTVGVVDPSTYVSTILDSGMLTVTNNSSAVSSISVPGMSQYTDSAFGFSFWYPSGWQVQKTGQSIIVGANDNSHPGVTIQEVTSSDRSVTDNSVCGAADGCPSSIRYYFDTSSHTWMKEMYYQYPQVAIQAPQIVVADVSTNTMGGLHILQGNARFGDDVIVPLSAENFLVIHSTVTGDGPGYKLLVNTITALDPSVATPVSHAQQTQIIQAEASAYAGQ